MDTTNAKNAKFSRLVFPLLSHIPYVCHPNMVTKAGKLR